MNKVVILFSKLSDYMLSCCREWAKNTNVEIHIIRNPVDNKEAPFKFEEISNDIYFYNRMDFDFLLMLEKVQTINPSMIICSGWSDKDYLKVVTCFFGKIPTILTMDNQWEGKLRQRFARFFSPFYLTNKFSHIWVPGYPQEIYARKLGFEKEQILNGFYVANSDNFSLDKINPDRKFEKKFIFVGRYIDIKGIKDLWQAFIEIQNETPNDWELICIGTGPLFEKKVNHPKIKHLGFIQPKDLKKYISDGGVFVLPSHFEPWGVVVHEFALAGFPIIVSDKVGASSQFVINGKNGFIFKSKDIKSLKEKLIEIINKERSELINMREVSVALADKVTKQNWVNSINSILESKNKINE